MNRPDLQVLQAAADGGVLLARASDSASNERTGRRLDAAAVRRAVRRGWITLSGAVHLDFHYQLAGVRPGPQGDRIDAAALVAIDAHDGQVDKAGEPYIFHPASVAALVAKTAGSEAVTVAWLHDVVEDTDVTLDAIRQQFGDSVADAVEAITARPHEPRGDYYRRVAGNQLALQVKRADVTHNSNPGRLERLDPETRERLATKYAHATEMLNKLEAANREASRNRTLCSPKSGA